MVKKNSKERLFEVMSRVAPNFTGKALNEVHSYPAMEANMAEETVVGEELSGKFNLPDPTPIGGDHDQPDNFEEKLPEINTSDPKNYPDDPSNNPSTEQYSITIPLADERFKKFLTLSPGVIDTTVSLANGGKNDVKTFSGPKNVMLKALRQYDNDYEKYEPSLEESNNNTNKYSTIEKDVNGMTHTFAYPNEMGVDTKEGLEGWVSKDRANRELHFVKTKEEATEHSKAF